MVGMLFAPLHWPLIKEGWGVPIDITTPENKLQSVTHNHARTEISWHFWHCATSARSAHKLVPRDEPAQALIRIKPNRVLAPVRLKDCRRAKTTADASGAQTGRSPCARDPAAQASSTWRRAAGSAAREIGEGAIDLRFYGASNQPLPQQQQARDRSRA